jgi:hypothetical protein
MMTLQKAAEFFNSNVFTDAFGSTSFSGQLLPFPDSTRSGSSTKRRILDVAPEVVIPSMRTVRSPGGKIYIIADSAEDLYQGSVIRKKYPVVPMEETATVRTVAETLAGSGGQTGVYIQPSYMRRNILEEQSDYLGTYEIYYSSAYTIASGAIIVGDGKFYRTMSPGRKDDIGFGVVNAIELEAPLQTLGYKSLGVYDGATDTTSDPAAYQVNCVVESALFDFTHESLGYIKLVPGDRAISFLKAAVPLARPGDTIGAYRIDSVTSVGTYWATHCRKS